jgi:hypothetical protein
MAHYFCATVGGMKSATLPAVRVAPELRIELEAVLDETESISAFVEEAVRSAVSYRRTQAEFLARGERAWQEYQRTGLSRPAAEVFDRIQGRIDARRQALRHPS